MSKRMITAILALATTAILATEASARVEGGTLTLASLQSERGSLTKPNIGLNTKGNARKYASGTKSYKKARYASKSGRSYKKTARHSHSGGGSSRSCLQSSARALLNRIESQFGPVSIISTCRPGAVIATSGKPSKHRNGLAIDFDAGSRKGAIVKWLIANHHSGGTMTYRDMSHIHIDVGYRFVSLGANSGRG